MSFWQFFIGSRWQWEYWQEAWGEVGKVFGRGPGVWQRGQGTAQNAPPYTLTTPLYTLITPPIYPIQLPPWILPVLAMPHLLVPAVPADEDLDGILGDGGGWSWGLCLTHLWKKGDPKISHFLWFLIRQAGLEPWYWVALSVAHQKLTGKEGSAQCVTLGADWRGKPALPQLRLSALSSADSRLNFYFLASLERILLSWGQRLLTGNWTFILVSDIIWSDSFDIGLVFKLLQLLLIYVQYVDVN